MTGGSGEDARRGIPPKCGGSDASPVGDGSPSALLDGRAAARALAQADVWCRAGEALTAVDLGTEAGRREVLRIHRRAVREERRLRLGLPLDPKTALSAVPRGGG